MSGDGTTGGGTTTPQQGAQMAPFMPGQQDAIASQLSAGFGQTPADISAWMNQVHKPTQLPAQGAPGTGTGGGGSTGNTGGSSNFLQNGGSLSDMEEWIKSIMGGIQSQMPPAMQQYQQGIQSMANMGLPSDLQALLSKFKR